MKAKFSVVMLVCGNLERSRDFYHDILGLDVKTSEVPARVDFELGHGMLLGLHSKTEFLTVRPGSLQLSFTVENVDRFVGEARRARVPIFQDPYDDSFGRVAIISDPDGYSVQVVTYSEKA